MKFHLLISTLFLISFSIFAQEKPFCTIENNQLGWRTSRTGGFFIPDEDCKQSEVHCRAIGSRSEGWYVEMWIPMENYNDVGYMTCTSEDGVELLNGVNSDSYRCQKGVVNYLSSHLIRYSNCSGSNQ